jgi:hypothetical protein
MAMVTEVRMAATVGDDRRLDVQLPADAPTGPVEVIVRAAAAPASEAAAPGSAARTAARAKMAAAGFLSEAHRVPPGAQALSVDELSAFYVDTSALAKRYGLANAIAEGFDVDDPNAHA